MKFRNDQSYSLTFKLGLYDFNVEPGMVCEIPDPISYVIGRRGIPLTPLGVLPSRNAPKGRVAVKAAEPIFSEDLSDIPLPSEADADTD